jgi:hypothetical protein
MIWPKDLDFLAKIKAFTSQIKKEYRLINASTGDRKWDNTFTVYIDSVEHYVCDTEDEFFQVLDKHPKYASFSFHRCLRKVFSGARYGVGIDFTGSVVEIHAHSHELAFIDRVFAIVETECELEKGLKADPDKYRKKMLEPSIFVSRHFDSEGDAYFRRLERPLNLLGFSVLQGEDYAAAPIPQKVKHRIEKQDIMIVVVSGQREHDWLTAEIGYALGKNKHVLVMKERASDFNTTILGNDFECIDLSLDKLDLAIVSLLTEFRQIGVKGLYH